MCLSLLSRKHIQAQDNTPFADENVDDLGDVSDEFSELFFEALKQKGIENYELALEALDQCIQLAPKQPIIYFEKGKNETALKQYNTAEVSFKKSLELKPDQPDVYESLFKMYETAREYEKAIETGQYLVSLDADYREDLARVYINSGSYNLGLDLLDALDNEKGKDTTRNLLRERAYKRSRGNTLQIQRLSKKATTTRVTTTELEQLIYLYIADNKTDEATRIGKQLNTVDPENTAAQLAGYKTLLNTQQYEAAVTTMQLAIATELPVATKKVILQDYINLVKENEAFQEGFDASVATINSKGRDAQLYRLLSTYYSQKNKETASGSTSEGLSFLEKALQADPENLELITKVAQAQLQAGNYDNALKTTAAALELFPSQPQLYLDNAKANNALGNFDAAIESLELGIDYSIDNKDQEVQFYQIWANAYKGKGDTSNYNKYLDRARAIKPQG